MHFVGVSVHPLHLLESQFIHIPLLAYLPIKHLVQKVAELLHSVHGAVQV